jgi:dihydropteroate synthase
VPVSVDTTKAAVAAAALEAGATMVNDVSAGRNDARMFAVVAASGAQFVAMHMLGEPRTMQQAPHYDDVVAEVTRFLVERVAAAVAAGIEPEQILADPGIGFGKNADHNLTLLAQLRDIVVALPVPVLVGTSRKSFLGHIAGAPDAAGRDDATLATVTWAFDNGAAMVRVHDVRRAVRTARLIESLAAATPEMQVA